MYAVVDTGGKQAKVTPDSVIAVEKLDAGVGERVTLPVLMIADGDSVLATPEALAGASVTVEVLEHFKGDKQVVFKFKRRKGYKRTRGHRQPLTAVRVVEIAAGSGRAPAKAAKKAASETSGAADVAAVKAEKASAKPKKIPAKDVEPIAETAPAAAVAATVEPAQCEALKADGTRCTNKAKEGSKYCGVHAKKLEG
jgi:large subunit ribosomal protein L21